MQSRFLICSLILILNSTAFAEPTNMAIFKRELINYADSGKYINEVNGVLTRAKHYLRNTLTKPSRWHRKRLAIVLDIDETSLSNYPHIKIQRFCGTKAQFVINAKLADSPAIKKTLKLFNYAKKNHIAIFFVTGRTQALKKATENNLRNAGYQGWAGLYLKPDNYSKLSIIAYKSAARRAIEKHGYTIVLNIGDQLSDLKGGHAIKQLKLPNPFYYVP